jgi:hypothetical protein
MSVLSFSVFGSMKQHFFLMQINIPNLEAEEVGGRPVRM